MLEIIETEFNDPAHARALLALLDEYARGDMGSGEPLSEAYQLQDGNGRAVFWQRKLAA